MKDERKNKYIWQISINRFLGLSIIINFVYKINIVDINDISYEI